MQLNKVKTIDRLAAELGESVDRLFELAINMEPEDGVVWVYGPGDDSVTAFSVFGIQTCARSSEPTENAGHTKPRPSPHHYEKAG